MDSLRLLAHRPQPPRRVLARSEVDVAQLCDRVADEVVDRARHVAAVHVRDGDVEVGRGDGAGQHLAAVAEHDDDVGPQLHERVSDAPDRVADGAGLVGACIAAGQVAHPGGNGHAVGLDLLHGLPELALEVHSGHDQRELEAGVLTHPLERLREQAVVGAGAGDVGDAAHV